jgi:hypothetical protein
MIQRGGGARLAPKTFQELAVLGEFFGQELERHAPAKLGVLGLVHHAHPATTQLLNNAVVGNSLTNHARNQPLGAMLGRVHRQVNNRGRREGTQGAKREDFADFWDRAEGRGDLPAAAGAAVAASWQYIQCPTSALPDQQGATDVSLIGGGTWWI